MSFQLGTKVNLKKESKYYYQCQHKDKIYEGTVVATQTESYPNIRTVDEAVTMSPDAFDVRVVWDFQEMKDGHAYFYTSINDLMPVKMDNNQDALGLLNKEEAW